MSLWCIKQKQKNALRLELFNMKLSLLILMFCFPLVGFGYDLNEIRLEFYDAVRNEKAADKFYKKLKGENLNDPMLLAYFGSAEAVRAKHSWNPYNKVAYLKSGLKNLNNAVSAKPDNLEIRFLRFSLEHYIPSFLSMSDHLDTDKTHIVKLIEKRQLGLVDASLLKNIINFMKDTKRCNASEIAILDKAI